MSEPEENETDITSFVEGFAGRLPSVVCAVKVVGKGIDGKRHTYAFLFASKSDYDRMVEQLPKGLIRPDDKVTTHIGTVEWAETGTLEPLEKEVKVMPNKKPRGHAA